MNKQSADEAAPVSFGARLASSQAFATLFRDGMSLVEETAAYLDGPGRQESKKLERSAALAYATESMRLTTRLMQIASWLLLHRAVKEGEMSLAQANKEKAKVKLAAGEPGDPEVIRSVASTPTSTRRRSLPTGMGAAIRSSASSGCSRLHSSRTTAERRYCRLIPVFIFLCCARRRRSVARTGNRSTTKAPARARALIGENRPYLKAAGLLLVEAEPGEFLLEARQPATAVEQLLVTAGPGRVRLRIDVEVHHVTLLAPGGAGGELGTVGHLHGDGMVIGMGVGLHR
jgi:hypothetical protein